jgi:Na+-transporting methylmalonyl-CoA/oxaloacetate decarboxylase gamma subunit
MAVAALVISILSVLVAGVSVLYARQQTRAAHQAVEHARVSADAARRSADLAEVVEAGRHYGWRIEPRIQSIGPETVYVLRNVGTVNARDVSLTGDYREIVFNRERTPVDIAAGQARFFSTMHTGERGGEIHITWTPDLPGAQPMTWTESPPVNMFRPPLGIEDWYKIMRAVENLAAERR